MTKKAAPGSRTKDKAVFDVFELFQRPNKQNKLRNVKTGFSHHSIVFHRHHEAKAYMLATHLKDLKKGVVIDDRASYIHIKVKEYTPPIRQRIDSILAEFPRSVYNRYDVRH